VRSQSHPKTLKMHSLNQTPSRSHSSWPMYNTSSNVGAVGRKPPSLRQSFLMCDRLHAFAILAHRLLDRHYWLVENLTLLKSSAHQLISSYGSRIIHTTVLSSAYARMPLQKIPPRDGHALQDIADLLAEAHRVIVITGRQQSPASTSFIDAVHSFRLNTTSTTSLHF
jgi:hypothetical protein